MSNTLYNRTSWTTQHALSSDHLPIITTINIRHDYRLQQNRRTFTNYKKADWTQFTEDTESAFAQTTITTNIHTTNKIFTNIILMADKQNIPKGKMHSNCRLLREDIVCKITQRNNIRRANTCDPTLKLLNEEITSDIQKHKQNIWKEHLDAHWDHRHNTHTLWKTIHGLSNRAPPHTLNTSITFNNKIETTPTHIANCFTKQFTNTVKHATHKTYRHINRATHNIQGYNITLTTSQVPLCPLCNIHTHDTHHLFNCTHIRTTLSPLDLWTDPAGVTALLARWTEKLAGGPQAGTSDSPH